MIDIEDELVRRIEPSRSRIKRPLIGSFTGSMRQAAMKMHGLV
jgi:hypothetical protein